MGDRYYKKYVEKLINSNPTDITIKRKEIIDDGEGGEQVKDVTIQETVTFYDRKTRREVVTDYGTTYVGVTVTKMLAKGDADIRKGDKFTVDDTEYKVLFSKPYFDICKQIEVEVIK